MGFRKSFAQSAHRTVQYTPADHRKWVDQCQNESLRTRDLSEWEEEFLEDMDALLRLGGKLSRKQETILERIYAEKTV